MTDTKRINVAAKELVLACVASQVLIIDDDGTVWRRRKTMVRVRAEYTASNGYLRIKVTVDDVRYDVAAHRIVYRAKVGPIPDGMLIDHEDMDITNNRPSNLKPVTPSRNLKLAYERGSRSGFAR